MKTYFLRTLRPVDRRLSGGVVPLLAAASLAWLGACEKHDGHDEHAGHDHAQAHDDHGMDHAGHDDHEGHDHDAHAEPAGHDEHEGHDDGEGGEGHVDEVTLTPEAVARYGVRIAKVQAKALEATFVAPARVGFNTEAMAHVGSTLEGRAVEIPVRLGDEVKKGDPLVIVESPELGQAQAEFLLKRTMARAAEPQVDLAKASWDRAKGLLEQSQGISLTEVQKREAEYKAALAAKQTAESAAVAAENTLRILGMDRASIDQLAKTETISPRYTIRAAIDGQVVEREITLGELVSPDRESLMVLADTSTLWVLADVPEARLASVAVGARAWVMTGSFEGERFAGQVAFISPLVDPMTRTAPVRIEVPRGVLGALRPGMFAQVEIAAAAEAGDGQAARIAVPMDAVQTVEGGPAVFVPVEGEPNTFAKRAVRIGPVVGGMVPVLSGLSEGEPFVAGGSFILKAELGKGSAKHEH